MDEHRITLNGGPFQGETVVWDADGDMVLVERTADGELALSDLPVTASYQRINADEAIYVGPEPPSPYAS